MNLIAAQHLVILSLSILAGFNTILVGLLGIQNLLVLAPVHNCWKRFKL